MARLRPVFHRADQALRFRAYMRGLLEPVPRKNVEGIANAASQAMLVETNLAQALHHFVSQSPWDSGRLFAAVRAHSREHRRDPGAVWVIHDVTFPKKGHHSVGVLRQFARAEGRKINCQIGVFLSQVGPLGFYPLAARLYLPVNWVRDNQDLAGKLIPADHCHSIPKQEIALNLLKELADDGEKPPAIVAEPGYLAGHSPEDALARTLSQSHRDLPGLFARVHRHLGWLRQELGLDHFEGRTWHGWHHHVALVFACYHLLATENPLAGDPQVPPFTGF